MYDDKQTEMLDKALILIAEIRQALANGTKHYRKSDDKLLLTDREILQALSEEGGVYFKPKRALI